MSADLQMQIISLLYPPALIVSIFQIVIKSSIIHLHGGDQMKFATKAIHSSYDCDEHNRALMPPIYQNSMFALRRLAKMCLPLLRLSNPTRQVLEDTVADLEHGAAGFAFSSGMAGIDAVWRTFLCAWAILLSRSPIFMAALMIYWSMFIKNGCERCFADLGNPDNLDELLKAHVKLVWLETRPIRF